MPYRRRRTPGSWAGSHAEAAIRPVATRPCGDRSTARPGWSVADGVPIPVLADGCAGQSRPGQVATSRSGWLGSRFGVWHGRRRRHALWLGTAWMAVLVMPAANRRAGRASLPSDTQLPWPSPQVNQLYSSGPTTLTYRSPGYQRQAAIRSLRLVRTTTGHLPGVPKVGRTVSPHHLDDLAKRSLEAGRVAEVAFAPDLRLVRVGEQRGLVPMGEDAAPSSDVGVQAGAGAHPGDRSPSRRRVDGDHPAAARDVLAEVAVVVVGQPMADVAGQRADRPDRAQDDARVPGRLLARPQRLHLLRHPDVTSVVAAPPGSATSMVRHSAAATARPAKRRRRVVRACAGRTVGTTGMRKRSLQGTRGNVVGDGGDRPAEVGMMSRLPRLLRSAGNVGLAGRLRRVATASDSMDAGAGPEGNEGPLTSMSMDRGPDRW